MHEKARFCASLRTVVKAASKAAAAIDRISIVQRDLNHLVDTMYAARKGPKVPTVEETTKSRYALYWVLPNLAPWAAR